MGYRSDVTISFYTSNGSDIPFAAVKLWFDENYPKQTAVDEWGAEIEEGQNYVNIWYTDVKWYDDYEHVRAVQAAIAKFVDTFDADTKPGAHYEMVEVGEDINDISHKHSEWCHYLLHVDRTIRFD